MTARIVASIGCLLIFSDVARGDCLTASPVWRNTVMAPQSGRFTVEFDATPSNATMNGITALSQGAGSSFDDYAILVRFNHKGRIVVHNGGEYAFDEDVLYTAGSSHHIRVQIDLPNRVYSVWVKPPSGPEVRIATDYDFRESQNTVENLDHWGIWSGQRALEVCNFRLVREAPPLEASPTSAGLVLGNAEFVWIRSCDAMGRVDVIVGSLIGLSQEFPGEWLYFATSECLEWQEDPLGCSISTMQLGLTAGVRYDLVAWSEARDRREPERQMLVVAHDWAFHPADTNMDGVVDCADLEWLSTSPYDWNMNGEVTAADLDEVATLLATALADPDGDGMVNTADEIGLLANWGPCPSTGKCPGDLDCDGVVGSADYLILLNLLGS